MPDGPTVGLQVRACHFARSDTHKMLHVEQHQVALAAALQNIGRHIYRVLLVDDTGRGGAVRRMLTDCHADQFGFDVRCASADELPGCFADGPVDVVVAILDNLVAGDAAAGELIDGAASRPVVIIAPDLGDGAALAAIAHGAQDVLAEGSLDEGLLAKAIRHAVHRNGELVIQQRQAQEYRSNLRAVVNLSAEAILVVDKDGVIRFANAAAAALFGRDLQQLLGMPYDYPTEPGQAGEISVYRPDGSAGEAIVRTAMVTWHGAEALLVTLMDVTTMRKKDRRLREAINMEAIGRLTAGVAHDFNNKLTIITGFARLALAQLDGESSLQDSLQEIARASGQSAKLVNQLLSFGKKQLRPKSVDLVSLLESIKPSLSSLIGPNVAIAYAVDGDLGSVRVDAAQMEEAITNLATNARDAMHASGEMNITLANVELSAAYAAQNLDATAGPHVMLRVSDTGTGMDARTIEQIFQPFFTTKPSDQGTGIGLATVYAFTVQSGGHIVVESQPSVGASFSIYLPRMADPGEQAASAAHAPDFGEKGEGVILLVEDEQPVRDLLRRVLTACGYTVLAAANGPEALVKSDARQGKIDLLITDVVMPGMNGRILANNFSRSRPEAKVLYISGYTGGVVDRDEIAAEGATLLSKPFSPDDLLAAVKQQLAQVSV